MKKILILTLVLLPLVTKAQYIYTDAEYIPDHATGTAHFALAYGLGTREYYRDLQKYWWYRYRLVNDFMKIGTGIGESIPAVAWT